MGRSRAVFALVLAAGLAGCATPGPPPAPQAPPTRSSPAVPATAATAEPCPAPGWAGAAAANAASLDSLAVAPFGRTEAGWAAYVPRIQQEVATACPPHSQEFAAALAAWQSAHGRAADGILDEAGLMTMKTEWQARRPFVRRTPRTCPETPDVIAQARPEEGLDGKTVWLEPAALAAYRRMVGAARAEVPDLAADPEALTIFSGYRSPSLDAARCLSEGNCDGIARAACSSHRTGQAIDLYVGHAEGFAADSTADPNRRLLSRTAAYRWLVANAGRFGFVNYAFEPWHWEWTGAATAP